MTANSVHHIVFVDLAGPEAEAFAATHETTFDGEASSLEYLGGVGFPHPGISGAISFVGFKSDRPSLETGGLGDAGFGLSD